MMRIFNISAIRSTNMYDLYIPVHKEPPTTLPRESLPRRKENNSNEAKDNPDIRKFNVRSWLSHDEVHAVFMSLTANAGIPVYHHAKYKILWL